MIYVELFFIEPVIKVVYTQDKLFFKILCWCLDE